MINQLNTVLLKGLFPPIPMGKPIFGNKPAHAVSDRDGHSILVTTDYHTEEGVVDIIIDGFRFKDRFAFFGDKSKYDFQISVMNNHKNEESPDKEPPSKKRKLAPQEYHDTSQMFGLMTCACYQGNIEQAQRLLKKYGNNILFEEDYEWRSPLHWAVIGRKNNMVEWLLANGAQADIANFYEITPLQMAASQNNKEAYDLLQKVTINSKEGELFLKF